MKTIGKTGAMLLTLLSVLILHSFLAASALAQPAQLNVGEILRAENQHQVPNIGYYIVRLINFLAMTIGSFAFLALVVGGMIMITSFGSEEKVTKGKDIIKFSLMGLLTAIGAYWTTAFVQSIFYDL